MACCERNLEELKKDYALFEKKYSLPDFEEMNHEFLIESLAETETELLLNHIRKTMAEKLAFFYKFIEVILNPSEGGSLFVFSVTKTLKQEDRKILAEIYEKISKLEIEALKRELDYSEEGEAEFIKRIYSFWKESKGSLLEILGVIESNWDNKLGKNEKSYFR
ncbi:MAG: hypothetical protein ABIH28_03040 [archaeon]